MKALLIYPMVSYVFYMWGIAIYVFKTRFKAVKTGQVSPKYFKTYQGEPPPERAVLIGRHYDNQFQVPMLFLIGCSLHIGLNSISYLTVSLAWFFVASRILHAFVHLGSNHIMKRVSAFTLGWIAILFLWAELLFVI